ncbi:hypothetical protein BDFB_010313, partial [Asbolus verrucosus]
IECWLLKPNIKNLLTCSKNEKARRARERGKQKALAKKQHVDSIVRPSVDNDRNTDRIPAIRPNQLDLNCDTASGPSTSPGSQHINIAMAIDPTYPKKGMHSSSSFETSSSTVTTSTSSSSPGIVLPPPDISELEDESNVPPYMPIQGQRKTASLEKKQKKRQGWRLQTTIL